MHLQTAQEPCCQSSAYTGMHTGEEVVSKIATLRGHEAPVVDICFADAWRCRLDRFCMFLLIIFGDVCERQPYFLQGHTAVFHLQSTIRAHAIFQSFGLSFHARDPFVWFFRCSQEETKDTLPCNYLISVDLSGKDVQMWRQCPCFFC